MTHVSSHRPGTPCWVDLMTPDVEAARSFYGALFDWTFDIGGPESYGYTMCKLGGRNAAGMGQKPPDAPFPSAWSVYFAVADADETAAKIRGAGGQVVMEPMDVSDAGRMAVCADPGGAVFGLWQARQHTGAEIIDEPGAMTWREVNTRDGARIRDFYASIFDLEHHKMEGMDYWTLNVGDKAHAGVLQMDAHWPAEVPPHWMTYFAVPDVEAAAAHLTELGGKVCVPAFDSPYGRIAVVEDLAGAVFSIIKLSEPAK